MASKLLFLKERKKPKDHGTDDELAVVKAAAWAWYEHSSGSEGKTVSEFDATRTRTRTHREPRPSRYKLEALMKMDKEAKDQGSPIIQTKKSLLDAYEIESISRQLDNLIIESEHNKHGNDRSNPAKESSDRRMNKKKKKKKIIRKWFWPRHGAICGTGEDVIDSTSAALRNGRRQLAKRVPVVNLVKCLPMAL